jgi:hypothetical protein
MSDDGDKNKKSRKVSSILCLVLVGVGIYGVATDDFGYSMIILGSIGLACIAITGEG